MKHHFGLLITVLLLITVAMPTVAQEEGPPQVGLRPDAPEYALHGPYWVGTMDFPITFDYRDGTSRESKVTVWYPALNPDDSLEAYTYPGDARTRAYGGPLFFPRIGDALLDAAPHSADAPYPLIVYSHGGWGYRWFQPEYTEHLASHGFVVIATDHEDAPPISSMTAHYELSRQWDISLLIDFAVELATPEGALAGMVDAERIGVTGYSAGGFTAMLAGGARRSSVEKSNWCATAEAQMSWIGPLLCQQDDVRDSEWARLLEINEPADGLWPAVGDMRVDTIVSLDGGAHDFGPDGLSYIRVPALLFFARGAPGAIPYQHDTLFESMTGKEEAIAIFEEADHALFSSNCVQGMLTAETVAWCAEPVWDKDRAHDLINHFTTAFLLDVLKGDEAAHAALAPDAVSFPGITYEAEGF